MRLLLSLVLITVFFSSINAQKGWEIGGWLGTSFYFGDLNNRLSVTQPGIAGGLNARWNFNTRISLKNSLNFGTVGASDVDSPNNFEKANLNQSKIKNAELAQEKQSKENAAAAINATQKSEMHKSKLAVNEQQIANGKALQDMRNQKVEIQKEANNKSNELEAVELFENSGGKNLSEESTILGE